MNDETHEQVLEDMKQRHYEMHIECGASHAQAKAAWQRMVDTPIPFDFPTFEELGTGENYTPMTDAEWDKMDAEFEFEKQRHMAVLREHYAKLNKTVPLPAAPDQRIR